MTKAMKSAAALCSALALLASGTPAWADEVEVEEVIVMEEEPAPAPAPAPAPVVEKSGGPLAIAVDLLIGRPTLLMATIAGAAFYGISLPVTLPSGTEESARGSFLTPAQQLVQTPLGGKLTPAG
jgi:hypothetical protein